MLETSIPSKFEAMGGVARMYLWYLRRITLKIYEFCTIARMELTPQGGAIEPRALQPHCTPQRINDALLRGYASGAGEETLKLFREKLKNYFGCSAQTVSARAAWFTMRGEEARTSLKLEKGVSLETYLAAFGQYHLSREAERNQLVRATAERWGCQFEALSETFKNHLDSMGLLEQTNPPIKSELSPSFSLLSVGFVSSQARIDGAMVDYTNPTKNDWRSNGVGGFLDRTFTPAEFSTQRVLCMPSAIVGPEVSEYLKRGVPPYLIDAIEGDPRPEVQATFLENCVRYGINPILGLLQDELPKSNRTYGIVVIDLIGQMSETCLKIMKDIPVSKKAALIVNVMGKRERANIQDLLDLTAARSFEWGPGNDEQRLKMWRSLSHSTMTYVPGIVTDDAANNARALNPHQKDLKKNRLRGMGLLIKNYLGTGRRERWKLTEEDRSQVCKPLQFDGIGREIEFENFQYNALRLGIILSDTLMQKKIPEVPGQIQNLILRMVFGTPFLAYDEVHLYHSPVSNNKTPYVSWMAELHTHPYTDSSFQEFRKFMIACVIHLCGSRVNAGSYEFRVRKRSQAGSFGGKPTNILEFVRREPATIKIANMSFTSYADTLTRLGKWQDDLTKQSPEDVIEHDPEESEST